MSIKEIVTRLAGSASLCWTETPAGVFDSTQALKFTDEALSEIEAEIEKRKIEWKKEKLAEFLT